MDTLMKNITFNVMGKANCILFFDWTFTSRKNRASLEAPVEIKVCIEQCRYRTSCGVREKAKQTVTIKRYYNNST